MFRLCFRYSHNYEDAQEILQNGFLKVFLNLSKVDYRGEKQFENWLKTIFINESINFIKQRKLEFVSIDDIKINAIDNNDDFDSSLTDEIYYQFLMDLPVGYRTIFNLYAIEGYSHKEIADKLSISESTSRSQLTKARKLLQKNINETNGIENR